MTTTTTATLARMPLADLLPADYNPRTIGETERRALKKSLGRFGQATTLTWNKRTGRLVGGHQRAAVLKAIGETHADVSVVDLDETAEKALNIALNSDALAGKWDPTKLEGLLHEIEIADPAGFEDLRLGEIDRSLSATGSRAAIDGVKERIASATPHEAATDTAERMIEAITTKIRKLAETSPERLSAAIAVVIPSRRGTEILVLADPNTSDAAAELRRLAEQGHPSPVDALLESIAPMHAPSQEPTG